MKHKYRPEIDGLRAIAVLAVILYHAKIPNFYNQTFKGGFIGVDIFFVISGYLITSIILKELFMCGSFSFKNFYERRARRILPVLIFVIITSIPLAWIYLLPSSFIDFSNSIIYSLGFISNIYFWYSGQQYGAESGLLKPFLHTWSLSVEEQYYISFPIILLIIFKYFRKYLLHIMIFGFVFSLSIANWGSQNYPSFNFYGLPTRIWELLSGGVLAYFEIKNIGRNKNRILSLILPFIGISLIFYSILFFNDEMYHPSFYTLLPITGTCLIIKFSNKNELITKILSSKLFVGIGLISYSLYLWHYPIFAFDRIIEFSQENINKKIILGILIVTLSIFSYFLIERPARTYKKFKLIFFYIFLSYTFLFASAVFFINIIPNYFETNLETNFKSKIIKKNCKEDLDNFFKCSLNFKEDEKKIYLIGDSHVRSFGFDLKDRIIKNYEVNIIGYNLCFLFREFDFIAKKTNKKNCSKYNSLEKFLKKENSIFIIAGRFPVHLNRTFFNNYEGGIEPGNFANDYEYIKKGKYESIEESFSTQISKLSKKNHIILVYPIPEIGWNFPQKLFNELPKKISFKKDYYIPKNYLTTSYDVYKKRTKSSFELLDSIKGAKIYRVYPHKIFCNTKIKERCLTHDDGKIFYSDNNHLSHEGAKLINNLIIEEIKKISINFE